MSDKPRWGANYWQPFTCGCGGTVRRVDGHGGDKYWHCDGCSKGSANRADFNEREPVWEQDFEVSFESGMLSLVDSDTEGGKAPLASLFWDLGIFGASRVRVRVRRGAILIEKIEEK